MKQYISDIISFEEIQKWQKGDRILIRSQTGTGKSEFIKTKIYEYCKSNDLRCLLLSNRVLLKNQNLVDVEDKSPYITAKNYQELEFAMVNGWSDIYNLFDSYDFIIYDEAHYFFADSQFNRNTDLLLEPILNTPRDKIFMFLTATPQALLRYQNKFNFVYNVKTDYSYIKNIYFYNKSETINEIIQSIPLNEKIIYFASDALDAYEISLTNSNAQFICSESNKNFSKKSSDATKKEIEQLNKFNCRLLCATKVLDNGVNILDNAVKHIIIDMVDPISFIQCLGRKRIVEPNETINLYIKNYHGGSVFCYINNVKRSLSYVKELEEMGINAFMEFYKKKDFDNIIQNDFSINQAKLIHYQQFSYYLGIMINSKFGYQRLIYSLLHKDYNDIKSAEDYFEKATLSSVLESYVNKRIYSEDMDKFKSSFFESIFSPKKTDYRKRGFRSIRAIIEEDGLPYQIVSGKDTRKSNRGKTYWLILKV